jgi:hypothetical protein
LVSDDFENYTFEIDLKPDVVYTIRITAESKFSSKVSKLTFNSNYADYFISFNDGAAVLSDKKTAEFYLNNGEYEFKFEKDNYNTVKRKIFVKENTVIPVNFTEFNGLIAYDSLITARITSSPSFSDIYLNGMYLGMTPKNVKFIKGEEYKDLKIEKSNYQNAYQRILSLRRDTNLNFELISKFSEYTFNTSPEGANVYLDGEYLGKTPIYNYPILKDSCNLLFHLEKYYTEKIIIDKTDEKKKLIDIKLEPNYGYVEIFSNPSSAEIYLDGEYVGKTPYRNIMIESQNYELILKKGLWLDYRDSLVITDLCDVKKSCDLLPGDKLSKVVLKGNLPEGIERSKFYVNDKKSDQRFAQTFFLEEGLYNLNIYHPEYFDKSLFVNLKESEVKEVEFELKNIRKQKFKWALNKWIALGISACSLGGAYFLNEKANDYYDNYLLAGTSKEADELYTKTQKFDLYRNLSAGLTSVSLVWFFVSNNNYINCDEQTTWQLR